MAKQIWNGKYIIKSNIPTGEVTEKEHTLMKDARKHFFEIAGLLSKAYDTKVSFRSKPLRGTIKVEIDGFYYYVELYIKK